MENRAYALMVGLFTLVLGVAALAAFWWFSGGTQASTRYLIVSSRTVTGLNPQAAVRYRGVRVGKVIDVELNDSREVYIQIRVDADIPVTRGTRARVATQGLTGLGYIQLDDDGSDPAEPSIMPGSGLRLIAMNGPGASMQGATEAAQDLMGRLKNSSERMEKILSEENIRRIEQTLQNLSASSASLDKALAQTAALAADLRRFAAPENAERLAQTLDQVRAMSAQLSPAIADFRQAAGSISAAGHRINHLGGSLQEGLSTETLPRMNELMESLHSNSQQLVRVLDELERNPQQLLLGKPAELAGPGEKAP